MPTNATAAAWPQKVRLESSTLDDEDTAFRHSTWWSIEIARMKAMAKERQDIMRIVVVVMAGGSFLRETTKIARNCAKLCSCL
jgi:hypothetical protein